MSFFKFLTVACLMAGSFAFADAANALTITYIPGTDESIKVAADPNNNNNNCCGQADTDLFTGRPAGNTWSLRSVLRFDDVATLPDNATIDTATLRLYRTSTPEANDGQQKLYLLTSGYTATGLDPTCCAGDVDNRNLYQLADGIAGASVGTPIATFTAVMGYNNFDVTSIVQDWQSNNWTNAFGFGLVGVENNSFSGVTYGGAFSANPMQLVLEYMVPPPAPEPTTFLMALFGAGWLVAQRRFRRKQRALQS